MIRYIIVSVLFICTLAFSNQTAYIKKSDQNVAFYQLHELPNWHNKGIYVIKPGTKVEILQKKGDWYKIRTQGRIVITGWISKDYIIVKTLSSSMEQDRIQENIIGNKYTCIDRTTKANFVFKKNGGGIYNDEMIKVLLGHGKNFTWSIVGKYNNAIILKIWDGYAFIKNNILYYPFIKKTLQNIKDIISKGELTEGSFVGEICPIEQ